MLKKFLLTEQINYWIKNSTEKTVEIVENSWIILLMIRCI